MEPASPDRKPRTRVKQRARVVSRRLGLTSFWTWWAAELAPLIPHRLRNAVARMRMRPVLAFETDAAVLWVPVAANGHLAYKKSTRIPLTQDAEATALAGRAAIDALASTNGGPTPPRVVVALAPEQVLRKTITLPAAVEENLAQVLAYDLDRHTPFKPEEVSFDATIVGRDTAKKEVRIDWAAALKSVVEELRRRAESWGASVVAVTPDRPVNGAMPSRTALNLLPVGQRPDAASGRGWEIWAPLALIAAAVLFATALPLWQKRGYAIALQQQAMQGRAAADASNALREQLERLTGDYNFALARKYAFPSALQSVEDLSRLLPDDTWLTQLEVKNTAKGKDAKREIVVRGESGNAGRLISLFEESKLFSDAAPRSPTTKIQPGPGEIFDVGAQLKPMPPPVPLQLASAGEVVSPPATPIAPAVPTAPVNPAGSTKPELTKPEPTKPESTKPEPTKPEPTESADAADSTKSATKQEVPQATTVAPPGTPSTPPSAQAPAATPAAPPARPPAAAAPTTRSSPAAPAGVLSGDSRGGGSRGDGGEGGGQRPARKATP